VDSDDSLGRLTELIEALDDVVIGRAAVHEEQFRVDKPSVSETPSVIHPLVQPDHIRHVTLAEIRKVGLRRMERVASTKEYKTHSNNIAEQQLNNSHSFDIFPKHVEPTCAHEYAIFTFQYPPGTHAFWS